MANARDCVAARVPLAALVLFGSRARGDARDDSDWDLAIVSEAFEGASPLDRGLRIEDCQAAGLDFVCLAPSELLQPEGSYLRCAVLEEGISVFDQGAYARARERYEREKAAGRIRFQGSIVEFAT